MANWYQGLLGTGLTLGLTFLVGYILGGFLRKRSYRQISWLSLAPVVKVRVEHHLPPPQEVNLVTTSDLVEIVTTAFEDNSADRAVLPLDFATYVASPKITRMQIVQEISISSGLRGGAEDIIFSPWWVSGLTCGAAAGVAVIGVVFSFWQSPPAPPGVRSRSAWWVQSQLLRGVVSFSAGMTIATLVVGTNLMFQYRGGAFTGLGDLAAQMLEHYGRNTHVATGLRVGLFLDWVDLTFQDYVPNCKFDPMDWPPPDGPSGGGAMLCSCLAWSKRRGRSTSYILLGGFLFFGYDYLCGPSWVVEALGATPHAELDRILLDLYRLDQVTNLFLVRYQTLDPPLGINPREWSQWLSYLEGQKKASQELFLMARGTRNFLIEGLEVGHQLIPIIFTPRIPLVQIISFTVWVGLFFILFAWYMGVSVGWLLLLLLGGSFFYVNTTPVTPFEFWTKGYGQVLIRLENLTLLIEKQIEGTTRSEVFIPDRTKILLHWGWSNFLENSLEVLREKIQLQTQSLERSIPRVPTDLINYLYKDSLSVTPRGVDPKLVVVTLTGGVLLGWLLGNRDTMFWSKARAEFLKLAN